MFHVTQVSGYSIIVDHLNTINTSFVFDDFSHCVRGTTQNIIIVRPVVPTVWPIQEGIKLTQKEATTLKEARFSFDCLCKNNV
jgi:hypothetical protein